MFEGLLFCCGNCSKSYGVDENDGATHSFAGDNVCDECSKIVELEFSVETVDNSKPPLGRHDTQEDAEIEASEHNGYTWVHRIAGGAKFNINDIFESPCGT